MPDETEPYRRQRLAEINAEPALEAEHGKVWSTEGSTLEWHPPVPSVYCGPDCLAHPDGLK